MSEIEEQFTVRETENEFTIGTDTWDGNFRDRYSYDREKLLNQAMNAWRSNPIAKRLVEITTEFVLGDGFSFESQHAKIKRVRQEFWTNRFNNMEEQLPEWADEAWRSGDLFILFSVDKGGNSFVRAVPAEQIKDIETRSNDYRQETFYLRGEDIPPYVAYDPAKDQDSFILHFPLSRAAGALFGESDLYCILHWLGLYRTWLEDRARLNTHRQLFAYVLQRNFANSAERVSYLNNFKSRMPKTSGGVIALDMNETLACLQPNLASHDAAEDGLALKRMIAIGAGIPLHYLAEPEESTRTTAEAAGTPTFKRFKRRQQYLRNVVKTTLQVALDVRRKHDGGLPKHEIQQIQVVVPDITERDNASLALGVQRLINAFVPLYNSKIVDTKEFIRLVYRFLAEQPPATTPKFSPINMRGAAGSGWGGGSSGSTPEPDEKEDKTAFPTA